MKANRAVHSVTTMSRVLGVSAGGFYAWCGRPTSRRAQDDDTVLAQIRRFHQRARGTYGAPRIHRDLRAAGVRVGRKRVARLMKFKNIRQFTNRLKDILTLSGELFQRLMRELPESGDVSSERK